MKKIRLLFLLIITIFPSFLKIPIYRFIFGYKIGKKVKIGFSLLHAQKCVIEDGVIIKGLNIFINVKDLKIGAYSHIGTLNILRGGIIELGSYTTLLRLNEINSIIDPIAANIYESKFLLGDGSLISSGHKIDFTDKVSIGKCVVIGGRNSSIWTHNREETNQIKIGDYSYLGSEVRMAPGACVPSNCIVGMGSVITKKFSENFKLIGGVPAREIKDLSETQKKMIYYKTRPDIPDSFYANY